MKNLFCFLIAINGFISKNSKAQVTTNFNNNIEVSNKGQFEKNYISNVDFIINKRNIDSLLQIEKIENANSIGEKPLKIAVPIQIDLDIVKSVNWNYEKDFAFGKFTIKLTGALSSSISFDKFYLPKNTIIYIYNENGKMITGPITENENNLSKTWGSWVYNGDIINIEIKTPLTTIKDLTLHSNNIAYGYKEIYKSIKVGGFGLSGPCNINVICPLGIPWEKERNSVSTILSATGGEFCTGALIMNACSSNIPYYLTANHCFNASSATSGWRFAFQAWSTTCPNPGINTNGVMYNGASLKARYAQSDFCLVELNQTPPLGSGLHYAGWNKSPIASTSGTAIHHPKGDLMKISQASSPLVASTYGSLSTLHHWRANWSPKTNGSGQTVTPITEPSSSGSPLFDGNGRIVGQLHGGPSVCGGTSLWDFYGRFDKSWAGGGTNSTRLSNWLDPNNSGAITTNTTNINNLVNYDNISAAVINGVGNFCFGSRLYNLNINEPQTTVTWNLISPSGIATQTIIGNTLQLTRIGTNTGVVTISVTIATPCSSRTITKTVNIGNEYTLQLTESNKDCNSSTLSVNAPSGSNLTWTTTSGSLINNSPSPFTSTTNPVILSTVNNNADNVNVSYNSSGCIYSLDNNFPFCPCPNFDYGQVNWLYSPMFNGDPLVIELTGGATNASYYKWYVDGIFIQQTTSPYLWAYNWPCGSNNNVTCIAVINNGPCGFEMDCLPIYCGNYTCGNSRVKNQSNIKIYPNPANTETTIKLEQFNSQNLKNLSAIKTIKIVNKLGIVLNIFTNLNGVKNKNLNLSAYKDDLYFVLVSDGKNEVKLPLIIRK